MRPIMRRRHMNAAAILLAVGAYLLLTLAPSRQQQSPGDDSCNLTFTATPIPATEPAVYAQVIEHDLDQLAVVHDAHLAATAEEARPDPVACIELEVTALRVYPMLVDREHWGPAIVDVLVDSDVMRLRHEAVGILAVFRYDEAIDRVYDAFVDTLAAGGDVVPYLRALHDMIARCEVAPVWGEDLAEDLVGTVGSADVAVAYWSAQCLVQLSVSTDGSNWTVAADSFFDKFPTAAVLLARASIEIDEPAAVRIISLGLRHPEERVRLRSVIALQHWSVGVSPTIDLESILLPVVQNVDESDHVRTEALNALEYAGRSGAISTLARSDDPWVRDLARSSRATENNALIAPPESKGPTGEVDYPAIPGEFLKVLRAEMQVVCDEVGDWRGKDHRDPMRQVIRDLMEVPQPK